MAKLTVGIFLCAMATVLIGHPPPGLADVIPSAQVDIYAAKLGIQPDMGTLQQNESEGVTRFIGTVAEPCKLIDLGFKEVKKGDPVEITSLKNGDWRGKVMSTEQEKIFKLNIDWDAGD